MSWMTGRGLAGVVTVVAAVALGACGSTASPSGPGAAGLPGAGTSGSGTGGGGSGGGLSQLSLAGSPCQVLSLEEVAAAVGSKVTYDKSILSGGTVSLSEMFCAFANIGSAVPVISVGWEKHGADAADAYYESARADNVPSGASVSGLGLKAVCGTSTHGGVTMVIRTADRAWSLSYDFRDFETHQQSPPSEKTACDTLTAIARHAIDRLQGSGPLLSPTPGTSS